MPTWSVGRASIAAVCLALSAAVLAGAPHARAEDGPLVSSLTMVGEPYSPAGTIDRTWRTGDGTVTAARSADGQHVYVSATRGTAYPTTLRFRAPVGRTLEAGLYPRARHVFDADADHAGFDLDGGSCTVPSVGRQFTVHEISPDLSRLWISYVFRCSYDAPAVFGEVRINQPAQAGAFTSAGRIAWPASFPGVAGTPASVSLVNSGAEAFDLARAEIAEGAADFALVPERNGCPGGPLGTGVSCTVAVRFTPSAPGPRSGVLAFVDAAGSRRTVHLDGTGTPGANAFGVYDQGGDYRSVGTVRRYLPPVARIDWFGSSQALTLRGVVLPASPRNITEDFWTVTLRPGGSDRLAPGRYADDTRGDSAGVRGLSVSTYGLRCADPTGAFDIREVAFGPDDELLSISATFEQHCNGRAPAIYGSIAYRASEAAPAIPHAPPGPVVGLSGLGGPGSAALAWQNPTDGDFVGVVVEHRTEDPVSRIDIAKTVYTGTAQSTTVGGLSDVVSHTFVVRPRNDDGALGEARSVTVRPVQVSRGPLWPSSIKYGATAVLDGTIRLYEESTGLTGAVVVLEQQLFGSTRWTQYAKTTSGAAGAIRFSIKPTANASYRLVFAGSPGYLAGASQDNGLYVNQVVTAKAPSTAKAGKSITVTSTCSPADGAALYLQEQRSGKWTTVAKKTCAKATSFAIAPAKGSRLYRVHKPATAKLGAGSSATLKVAVS
ncbi:MAG: hypothetical protein ACT4QF_13960 [Sporichthyaceae bacterium]